MESSATVASWNIKKHKQHLCLYRTLSATKKTKQHVWQVGWIHGDGDRVHSRVPVLSLWTGHRHWPLKDRCFNHLPIVNLRASLLCSLKQDVLPNPGGKQTSSIYIIDIFLEKTSSTFAHLSLLHVSRIRLLKTNRILVPLQGSFLHYSSGLIIRLILQTLVS